MACEKIEVVRALEISVSSKIRFIRSNGVRLLEKCELWSERDTEALSP